MIIIIKTLVILNIALALVSLNMKIFKNIETEAKKTDDYIISILVFFASLAIESFGLVGITALILNI